jgi:gamma-glutamylaminecyclotransferase
VATLFVFGTLKRGFPLHKAGLAGAPFLGVARTALRFPMLIAGPRFAPMMFDEPGLGFQVKGEVYAVGEIRLARIDRLESVGEPGSFRKLIDLEGEAAEAAFVYMKDRALAEPVHSGYLEDYQDRRFRVPDELGGG